MPATKGQAEEYENPCLHNHLSDMKQVKGVSYYSHEILRHLYIMFEMIRNPTNSLYHSDEYENSLRCLESRITNIVPSALKSISDTVPGLNTAWGATIRL